MKNLTLSNYSLVEKPAAAGSILAPSTNYEFVTKWGRNGGDGTTGTGDGEFMLPGAITSDSDFNVYIADVGRSDIQKFDSAGQFITKWGGTTSVLNWPCYMATNSADEIVVVEAYNHRMHKFDSAGGDLGTFGSQGEGDNQFVSPAGVALDSSGNIYITEYCADGGGDIKIYTQNYQFIRKIPGGYGTGDSQYKTIFAITIDSSGNLYVGDRFNYRIKKMDSHGNILTMWGSQGSGDGQFDVHAGMVVDLAGNIIVADCNNKRIQKFDSTGRFLTKFSRYNGEAMNIATSVNIDSHGYLYVLEWDKGRILKFNPIP